MMTPRHNVSNKDGKGWSGVFSPQGRGQWTTSIKEKSQGNDLSLISILCLHSVLVVYKLCVEKWVWTVVALLCKSVRGEMCMSSGSKKRE